MSIVKIVHWKDIVGKENLESFMRIEKAIIMAERNNLDVQEVFRRLKDREGELEMWKQKRFLMRYCGYDEEHRRYGWYLSYLDRGEVKFKTTAPPDREYITLTEFLDYRDHILAEAMLSGDSIMTEMKNMLDSFRDNFGARYDDVPIGAVDIDDEDGYFIAEA
ncbi:MAG: hypothetical protein N2745_08440 [Syntrophorhabdaceae bacterium]|nr:hypothetical protein [Syntrophorhabdaceae bacterium]